MEDATDDQFLEMYPAVARFFLLCSAKDNDRNRNFLEQMALSVYPKTLELAKDHCLGHYDSGAAEILSVTASLRASFNVFEIDSIYGEGLDQLKVKILDWLSEALKKTPPDQQKNILSRMTLTLEAKKQGWLAKAKRDTAAKSEAESRAAQSPTSTGQENSVPAPAAEERNADASPVVGTNEGVALRVALNVSLIRGWMDTEGWTNQTLAPRLQTSERTISSLRNNGSYHGMDAITKLANLMGRDPDELYLHEASS